MGHPALQVGGVQEHVGKLDVVQVPVAERRQFLVELGADAAHLGLGDPALHPERRHEIIDLAGRHAVHVGLHDHGEEGPVDAPTALEQRREERPLAELRDLELEIASLGGQRPGPVPVSLGGSRIGPFEAAGTDRARWPRPRSGPGRRARHHWRMASMSPPARIASSSSIRSDW